MNKQINIIIQIACLIFMTLIVMSGVAPVKYDIAVGDTCPVDVYASRSVVDKLTTEKQKEKAGEDVALQYELDNDITLNADRNLANIFIELAKSRSGETSSVKNAYCQKLSETDFQNFRSVLTEIQQSIMNKGVTDKDDALAQAKELLRTRLYDEEASVAGIEILKGTIEINKIQSEQKTNEEIERAKENVPNVTYKKDQIIVRKGDIITEAQYGILSELGLINGKESTRVMQLIGAGVFMLSCIAVAIVYMLRSKNREKYSIHTNTMVCIICLLTLSMLLLNKNKIIDLYMIPVMTCGILLSILTEVKFSLLINAVICVIAAVTADGDAFYFASVFITGCLGIYIFSNALQRRKLVFSSAALCAVYALVFFSVAMLQGVEIREALMRGLYGAISAVISSVIVMGTLPFWENAFDIITPFRLSELANPNQPLLKRLLLEAPGTYHHSLMVGNLAEAACEEIGGNYLLARTGAYYHDMGKLLNPEMFTENQYGTNPHDSLPPLKSAQIIMNHVRDGVTLGRQYKLPEAICKIAATHHGKTCVAYFLHKARQSDENVDADAYRYPAHLPSTREEAVVMLADSCEAAVRSLDDKSEPAIEAMVAKIINGKVSDAQLTDTPLTFSDLEKIKETFIKVFGGYFHSRIKYPDGKDESK